MDNNYEIYGQNTADPQNDHENPRQAVQEEQPVAQNYTFDASYPMTNPCYDGAHRQEKRKSAISKKAVAGIVAACILLSAGSGFGGSLLANALYGGSKSGNSAVIYQTANTDTSSGGGSVSGSSLSIAEIAELAAGSIVEITTESVRMGNRMQQYVSQGAGSGVIITADGYIVTNHHVIEGASKITVRLKDGSTYTASVVGTDSKSDIAVVKINARDLQPAILGDSDKLMVGETAVAIGNPLGELGGTVTDGIISALDREITIDGETMRLLQTNAAINPGNSGGGLFNGKGELIGIVNAKSSGSGVEGLGFAIPINSAKTVIEQLISNGHVQGRIAMGITIVDITDAQTATQYGVQELGTYVVTVGSASDAERAGMKAGDRILTVDGKEITSTKEVKNAISSHSVGDKITVSVSRNGKTVNLSLTFTEQGS